MKISLTGTQYSALMDILGPPENVHHMIMDSFLESNKWTLEGDDDDFDDLLALISEEIGEGMCSKKNAQHLMAICKKTDPSSVDWIGC